MTWPVLGSSTTAEPAGAWKSRLVTLSKVWRAATSPCWMATSAAAWTRPSMVSLTSSPGTGGVELRVPSTFPRESTWTFSTPGVPLR